MKPVRQSLLFSKTGRGCGLVTLALALAWVAHGADPVLIGQWPGWPRGNVLGVAVSGNYAYVADGYWGLIILGPRTPRITSVTLAAGTATVYYTNTIAGTAYTLECRTNLTTGTWQAVGTQPAPGDSASQTDTAAGGDQRYYRVFYLPQ
jgi:hypothetical protein